MYDEEKKTGYSESILQKTQFCVNDCVQARVNHVRKEETLSAGYSWELNEIMGVKVPTVVVT